MATLFLGLGQSEEDNRELRLQLEAWQKKTATTAKQVQIEHDKNAAQLQRENQALGSELDGHAVVIGKLEERQRQLVELQSSVMNLWSLCLKSPKLAKVMGSHGQEIEVKDPLTMVMTIQVQLVR